MSYDPEIGSLAGIWTYRSLINNPNLSMDFDKLEFGRANIQIDKAPMGVFKGRIYGDGWELTLSGYVDYGAPNTVRFQGRGKVGGEEWIYDYVGYLSPAWPNGIKQRPALAGSIVRTVPHSNGAGGVAPAGVVCSWYAVLDKPAS
ncbi:MULTISPECIES: hypothetical protein [Burkholderia]|uniref:Uncharacterized protein n=1 Tax=Burkholderia mayonis TaxID=1385591 RepID=A0A1B4FNC3_9BURK|nr:MULTISPECIES: hypothetical protein [Burkholderia]AOJ05179.1 hypothetical protein WS70_26065 [Burkholderia mayonis]KVE37078.1 hypothetical protein WS69_02685 [Burkholderia sp. BDU5]KVE44934.1 hypothetical protein WS70_06220 [Burkholderia mayonis]